MTVINFPLRDHPITRMLTDRIGLHSMLLPLLIHLFVSTCFTSPRSGVQNGILCGRAQIYFLTNQERLQHVIKRFLARYDS